MAEQLLQKQLSDREAEQILLKALAGRKGALTRADAVALTGLPEAASAEALRSLMATYRSHLAVTEEGELLYRFDPDLVRRDRVPLAERIDRIAAALWRGFTVAFKIGIVVTLVFYVVAFLAIMIGLVLASNASDREDRRGGDSGFGFPWLLWWMMPDWAPPQARRREAFGRPRKRFYRAVFDFVFGPPTPPLDLLARERQICAYIRSASGRITATDLVALTGWSHTHADEEATRLLAAYDGEPEVAPDGTLVYSFPKLRKTTGEGPAGKWSYAWQERPTALELTGNTSGTNAAIGIMNGFNLFAAATVGPAFLTSAGLHTAGAEVAVFWFPLLFSALFFAIPAARWWRRRGEQRQRDRAQARAALLHELVDRRGAAAPPEELVTIAQARSGAAVKLVREELERLLVDLDGDVTTSTDGQMRYSFPRIEEELAAAAAARATARSSEQTPGEVVFSSDDEEPPPTRLN